MRGRGTTRDPWARDAAGDTSSCDTAAEKDRMDIDFRMDTLQSSIQAIQNETAAQQHAIDQLQVKRSELEKKEEVMESRLQRARARQMDLEASLNAQMCKVDELEIKLQVAESQNQEVLKEVEALQQHIEEEKLKQLQNLEHHEAKMATLAEKFRYNYEINDDKTAEEKLQSLQEKLSQAREECKLCDSEIEKLLQEERMASSQELWDKEVPPETRRVVLTMAEQELCSVHKELQYLQAEAGELVDKETAAAGD